MKCQWDALLNILPYDLKYEVDKHKYLSPQEIRIRIGEKIELITPTNNILLNILAKQDHIKFCVNTASKFSPWASKTIQSGYITAPGGHRLGLCGTAVSNDCGMTTLKDITSICIRIANDFPGVAFRLSKQKGSILIIGPPSSGKTTFLRDLIRQKSIIGRTVCVVDERQEIFPQYNNTYCFPTGPRTDIISSCKKAMGIEILLRTMGPDIIAVDEITASEDTDALLQAGWCGVSLIATAHALDKCDLYNRPVYKSIIQNHLFDYLVTMHRNKTWTVGEMCT